MHGRYEFSHWTPWRHFSFSLIRLLFYNPLRTTVIHSIIILENSLATCVISSFPFFIFLLISFYGELFELGTCHVHHKSLQHRELEKERKRADWLAGRPREDGS